MESIWRMDHGQVGREGEKGLSKLCKRVGYWKEGVVVGKIVGKNERKVVRVGLSPCFIELPFKEGEKCKKESVETSAQSDKQIVVAEEILVEMVQGVKENAKGSWRRGSVKKYKWVGSKDKLKGFRRKYKMEGVVYVDPEGLNRGLAVWLQKRVKMVVLRKNKSLIYTNVEDNGSGNFVRVFWVYGPTEFEERKGGLGKH
ncbi:hypothetical protein GOBAR_AA03146 [Gossypium barbadense]|uniref:Uncharacterized protein n=1 Tax=Gossypium barbadense TaxID=3634 RepID=A0A2P5YPB3_GOSBA|nr:hypothetical protein GOBAR_AA03146 [Gossypium barbadense]